MSLYQNNPELAKLSLGKPTSYSESYNPQLLQAVPRQLNREPLGITNNQLPFTGADIWTLYEISWLNARGLPQVAIAEVHLNANSANIIESKSFKLYLNSFNQTKFTDWSQVQQTMQQDLAQCAQGEIQISLLPLHAVEGQTIAHFDGECIDEQDISIDSYQFNEKWLENATSEQMVEETLVSHLLKSNCLITNQPDWGSVQIRYCGRKIDREALLRYLVSFRQHNEFHEQCVERIYCDIQRFCQPDSLSVYARYTRRGGLDINPYRTNQTDFKPATGRLTRQ